LAQITETSKNVNFIYLDFKGLKKDDRKKMDTFFEATQTTFVDASQVAFPIILKQKVNIT